MDNHNIPYLKPDEIERLALLMEEAGEVVQICGKILRHGYESHHPNGGESNREELNKELGDLLYAIELLDVNRDVNSASILHYKDDKRARIFKYLHHQMIIAREGSI